MTRFWCSHCSNEREPIDHRGGRVCSVCTSGRIHPIPEEPSQRRARARMLASSIEAMQRELKALGAGVALILAFVLVAPARADVRVTLEPAQRSVPVRTATTYIVTVTTDSPVTLSDVVLLLPGHGQPCGQLDEPGYPYGSDPDTNFQVLSPEPIVTGRWVSWPGPFVLFPDSSYEWDLDVLTPSVAACFYAGASAHLQPEGARDARHARDAWATSASDRVQRPHYFSRTPTSRRASATGSAHPQAGHGWSYYPQHWGDGRHDQPGDRLRKASRGGAASPPLVVGVAQGAELDVGQHDEFSTGGYFTSLGAGRFELYWWTSASADSLMVRERLGLPAGFTLVSSTLGAGKRRKSADSFSYQWDTPRQVPAGDYERESVVVDAPCSQLGSTIHARLRVWRSDGLVAGTGDGPEISLPTC